MAQSIVNETDCKGVPKGTRSKFSFSTEGGGAEPVVMAELQHANAYWATKEKVFLM